MTKKKAAISITIDHHLYDWLRVQPQKMSAIINTILAKHVANHMVEDQEFMQELRARNKRCAQWRMGGCGICSICEVNYDGINLGQ